MIKYRTMTALNNAHRKVDGELTDSPLCDGLASNALPEAQSSQTGVSVENTLTAAEANMSVQNNPPITITEISVGTSSVPLTDVLSRLQNS